MCPDCAPEASDTQGLMSVYFHVCANCITQQIGVNNLDDDFATRQLGGLCHSRWVTLADRIIWLYATTKNPSRALKRLAYIVVNFYAPCWFWIKSHPHCKDGPRNLLKMISFSRKLTAQEQKIAQKTIQQNGFYAHPEAILRSMLADNDQSLREKAVEKIRESKLMPNMIDRLALA